ncbi:MAG: DNA alkylation repair protein [Flavobacteriales bacterium]|nr:DNA alkylation repair protein [Flavobacteriales bacterium]
MHPYLTPLRQSFDAHRNSTNAVAMKAYMKGRYEYFGIKATDRRQLMRDFLSRYGLPERTEANAIIRELWSMPERELHYVAQEIAEKVYKKYEPGDLALLKYLATHNSWWDTVDFIASHLMGKFFKQHPHLTHKTCEQWLASDNMWLQRCVLLFQLKYKRDTDTALLFDAIRQLKDHPDFFIRKAIGWVLREYSKTDAAAVEDFLTQIKLSNLSVREASKYL